MHSIGKKHFVDSGVCFLRQKMEGRGCNLNGAALFLSDYSVLFSSIMFRNDTVERLDASTNQARTANAQSVETRRFTK